MPIDKIGKVAVLATLGTGANSSVLHVRRDADGREYALKVVTLESDEDRKFLDQADHEYRVAQMLDHPSLVKIHCYETESDWRFRVRKARLLIEYVPGETLDQAKLGRPAVFLRVFEQVAAGLVHMHKQGVLHADLKPGNLMLGRGPCVKVIDYGLAWIKGEAKARVQGTPGYMAPETAKHKVVNERTDIYNFGATMYRLLTFRLPPSTVPAVAGMELTEETFRVLLKPVRQLAPGVPAELAALVHQCLSFNALERPERMSAVQGALDRMADDAEAADPA